MLPKQSHQLLLISFLSTCFATPQSFNFKLDLPVEQFTPLCRYAKSPSSTCPNVNSLPHPLQAMLPLHLPEPEILMPHWLLFSCIAITLKKSWSVKLSSLHSHCHHTHSKHHHIAPEQFQELVFHLWFHPAKSSFILQSFKIKCGVGHVSLHKTLQWWYSYRTQYVHVHSQSPWAFCSQPLPGLHFSPSALSCPRIKHVEFPTVIRRLISQWFVLLHCLDALLSPSFPHSLHTHPGSLPFFLQVSA